MSNGKRGRVAELADAQDLGSCGVIRAGSTPVVPTIHSGRNLLLLLLHRSSGDRNLPGFNRAPLLYSTTLPGGEVG